MRLLRLTLLFTLLFPLAANATETGVPGRPAGWGGETPAEHVANTYAAQEKAAAPLHQNLPDYGLPPGKLAQAQHLAKVRLTLHFTGIAWDIAQFVLLLWLGIVAWMRDKALAPAANLRSQGKRFRAFWLECLIFTVLFNLVSELLDLPLTLYSHHLSKAYGLSIQSWAGWFGDWAKSFGLGLLGGLFAYALLMFLIRWLPRTWWLVAWGVAMPAILFLIYLAPLYIDPIFNKFEPLQKSQPQLVAQLEKVVERGHMNIPPDRMFLMKASTKVTTLNAYVTGFGSSKRVVVWDTSLTKGTPDEVLFIFGHESGHYVLGHILRGILMAFFGLLISLYLGYLFINWSIARFGPQWRIPSPQDWGGLVVLFFAFTLFSTVSEPLLSTISRSQEHAADVYGQEAIHGLVSDPQTTAQKAFDVLGENSLDDPNPSLFVEFWTENHPATGRRAAFAHAYNPWAPGMEPKYFGK